DAAGRLLPAVPAGLLPRILPDDAAGPLWLRPDAGLRSLNFARDFVLVTTWTRRNPGGCSELKKETRQAPVPSGPEPAAFFSSRIQLWRQPAAEAKQIEQGLVHQPFAAAQFGGGHLRFGAVAAFGGCLDRWEILLVIVAVAKDEEMFQPGP